MLIFTLRRMLNLKLMISQTSSYLVVFLLATIKLHHFMTRLRLISPFAWIFFALKNRPQGNCIQSLFLPNLHQSMYYYMMLLYATTFYLAGKKFTGSGSGFQEKNLSRKLITASFHLVFARFFFIFSRHHYTVRISNYLKLSLIFFVVN